MHLRLGFETVEQGYDVRVMQVTQDVDLLIQVLLELAGELCDINTFDRDK